MLCGFQIYLCKGVIKNENWTLMCPDQCPGLSDVYGDDFNKLYTEYENSGKGIKQLPARKIWLKILDSQIETGTPYLLYKDHANRKSNQKNLGTIKSSNLCCEIMEYSDDKETAVCNLASIAFLNLLFNPILLKMININTFNLLKFIVKPIVDIVKRSKNLLNNNNFKFEEINLDDDETRHAFYETVNEEEKLDDDDKINSVPQIYINDKRIGGYDKLLNTLKPYFDFDKLFRVTKVVTNNLNKVIDINFYPTPKTDLSNKF